jgi:hypothetical protein
MRKTIVALLGIGVGMLSCRQVPEVHENRPLEERVSVDPDWIAANHQADLDLNLIARIYRENGNAVEFYQPAPDRILVSEVGPATNTFLSRATLRTPPASLFRALSPGRPLPPELEATAVSDVAPVPAVSEGAVVVEKAPVVAEKEGGAGTGGAGASGTGLVQPFTAGACNQAAFAANNCKDSYWSPNDVDLVYQECLVPWYNGAYGDCYDIEDFWASVCADQGNVLSATAKRRNRRRRSELSAVAGAVTSAAGYV